ncbi:type I glutamate--ammonia ligase [Actinomadura harenae]|uniref:Glutamine synthetase n=1 Tax=Actinomadura harenae TaxID=2483351 RepID=A0A3M2M0T1_9ACTN|nr:glutamine synthetase family protein [Actinomadura harenae]RMI40698.1 glutamine synthetase [Actinomadura harenae]
MDLTERTLQGTRAAAAATRLAAQDIVAVVLVWVDTSGIARVKAVPLTRLEHAATWGVGVPPGLDAFLLDDSVVTGRYAGGAPVGDLRLHPDLDRLRPLAALPGWAIAPADRYAQDGTVHPLDSRALLRRETDRLSSQGWATLAAFEMEWVVSEKGQDEFTPATNGPAYGMTRISELSDYLRDLLQILDASGVQVEQIHPEYAPGQYELTVAAEDPLGAADTAVLVRETIRATSLRHGLVASFSPKTEPDSLGNGGHVHLSLWHHKAGVPSTNAMAGGDGPSGMTRPGEAFAAGILRRLPALLAIGAPSVASYLRLVPSGRAGAYSCWGPENREAALRFITGSHGEQHRAANVEVKCFDPSANPYLALAALLAAGRAGLDTHDTLPAPVTTDPALLTPTDREKADITPLPSTLEESVTAFESDPILRQSLGDAVMDTISVVRRGEITLLTNATPEQITKKTRWRH